MNVALVVLDTLRLDAFKRHFEWLPGIRFEQAWAPGNWTVPVHASLFTGCYPSELGVHAKHQTLNCPEPTLAECLNEIGYRTRCFSANPNISPIFQFDRGFDMFQGSWRLRGMQSDVFDWEGYIAKNRTRGPMRYLSALKEVLLGDVATGPSLRRGLDIKLRDLDLKTTPSDDGASEAREFVQSTKFDNQEFLFLNLMEAHAPYSPPEAYVTGDVDSGDRDWTTYNGLLATITGDIPTDATPEKLRQAYDDSVRYLSDVYQDIFASLRESFDVVITLGDHGEMFGEDGIYQHAYGLYPELTNVPLVISGDQFNDCSTDRVVSLVDVFHTVTELVGACSGHSDRALVSTDRPVENTDAPVYAEYHGVSDRNWQKVKAAGRDPSSYDKTLFGVADGGNNYGYQTRDGFEAPEEERENLHELVKQRIDTHENQNLAEEDDISEALKRQLEDLGYA